jgi:hypothetical protein
MYRMYVHMYIVPTFLVYTYVGTSTYLPHMYEYLHAYLVRKYVRTYVHVPTCLVCTSTYVPHTYKYLHTYLVRTYVCTHTYLPRTYIYLPTSNIMEKTQGSRCGAPRGGSKSNAVNLILRIFLNHFLHAMSS